MSTQIEERGGYVLVSTVSGVGKRKRMARGGVLVPKDDKVGIRAEVIRQAEKARKEAGIEVKE